MPSIQSSQIDTDIVINIIFFFRFLNLDYQMSTHLYVIGSRVHRRKINIQIIKSEASNSIVTVSFNVKKLFCLASISISTKPFVGTFSTISNLELFSEKLIEYSDKFKSDFKLGPDY